MRKRLTAQISFLLALELGYPCVRQAVKWRCPCFATGGPLGGLCQGTTSVVPQAPQNQCGFSRWRPKTKTPRTSRGVVFYENDCLRIGMDRQAINITR